MQEKTDLCPTSKNVYHNALFRSFLHLHQGPLADLRDNSNLYQRQPWILHFLLSDCRLVVTKETMTVEGMIKIIYDLLKDKLNIAKITFTSGVNAGSQEYTPSLKIDRCPLCGIALNENGVCPKCGYKK